MEQQLATDRHDLNAFYQHLNRTNIGNSS